MGRYTYFLFPRPSFFEGLARIFDFRNRLNLYNLSATAEEADARAIYLDWCAVGQDMRHAIRRYRKRLKRDRMNPGQGASGESLPQKAKQKA
jgi:hypothetical protein